MSTDKDATKLTFNIKFNGHEIKDISMEDATALYYVLDRIIIGNRAQPHLYQPNYNHFGFDKPASFTTPYTPHIEPTRSNYESPVFTPPNPYNNPPQDTIG